MKRPHGLNRFLLTIHVHTKLFHQQRLQNRIDKPLERTLIMIFELTLHLLKVSQMFSQFIDVIP